MKKRKKIIKIPYIYDGRRHPNMYEWSITVRDKHVHEDRVCLPFGKWEYSGLKVLGFEVSWRNSFLADVNFIVEYTSKKKKDKNLMVIGSKEDQEYLKDPAQMYGYSVHIDMLRVKDEFAHPWKWDLSITVESLAERREFSKESETIKFDIYLRSLDSADLLDSIKSQIACVTHGWSDQCQAATFNEAVKVAVLHFLCEADENGVTKP